jgi:hypothetical protein
MNIDWIEIILYIGLALISTNLIPIIFITSKKHKFNINRCALLFQTFGSGLIFANTIILKYNIIYILYSGVLCFTCIISWIIIIKKYNRETTAIPQ